MVDRFDGPPPPEMQPYVNGNYVRYSDYAELEMERDRLISELNTLRTHAEVIKALEQLLAFARALEKQSSRGAGSRRGGAIFANVESVLRRAREAQGGENG